MDKEREGATAARRKGEGEMNHSHGDIVMGVEGEWSQAHIYLRVMVVISMCAVVSMSLTPPKTTWQVIFGGAILHSVTTQITFSVSTKFNYTVVSRASAHVPHFKGSM